MSKKTNRDLEKEWKKLEQDKIEEEHQIELREGYEQDNKIMKNSNDGILI